MVASAPFRCPEAMAKSKTAEPPSVMASRMGNGRLVPRHPGRRRVQSGRSLPLLPPLSTSAETR